MAVNPLKIFLFRRADCRSGATAYVSGALDPTSMTRRPRQLPTLQRRRPPIRPPQG